MRYLLLIVCLCWGTITYATTHNESLVQIAYRAVFSSHLNDSDLDFAANNGCIEDIDAIRSDNGFLEPGNHLGFTSWLLNSFRKENMENTDAFRFSLILNALAQQEMYNYENYDESYQELIKNIDHYISDKEMYLAWNLISKNISPQYNTSLADWCFESNLNQIYFFLKNNKTLPSLTRLYLLLLQQGGYNLQRLTLSSEEVISTITEIDSLFDTLFPEIPDLKKRHQPLNLMSQIWNNFEDTFLQRVQLQNQLAENTLSKYDSLSLLYILGNAMMLNNDTNESQYIFSDTRRRLEEIIEKQSSITCNNADYLAFQLIQTEQKNLGIISTDTDDTVEYDNLVSLMNTLPDTKEGRRCKASALGSFMIQRNGQTKALPTYTLAKMYIDLVESDPHRPFKYENLAMGAERLFHGGHTEDALTLLNRIEKESSDMPYQMYIICNTIANCLNVQKDYDRYTEYANRAIEYIKAMDSPDYWILWDLYNQQLKYYLLNWDFDKAKVYADNITEIRSFFLNDEWHLESDWEIAYLDAISGEENNIDFNIKSLLDRAIDMGFLQQTFDYSYILANRALGREDKERVIEYMELCMEVFSNNPAYYGGITFANDYLNYLYNIRNDHAAWRRTLSFLTSYYEENHFDLNFDFIQFLGNQSINAAYSQNMEDVFFCIGIMIPKITTLFATINEYSEYTKYEMIHRVFPSYIKTNIISYNIWKNIKSNLTEKQQKLIESQSADFLTLFPFFKELLDDLIQHKELIKASNEEILDLSILNIQLTCVIDSVQVAQLELDKLKEWATQNNLLDSFEYQTLGVRQDIASLSGNYDVWVELIDNEQFWKCVSDGTSNIDGIASIMISLSNYYILQKNYSRAQEIVTKRFDLMREYVNTQYMQLSESQRETLSDRGLVSGCDIYNLLPYYHDNNLLTLAYDASLYYKNLLLESTNTIRRAVYASKDSVQIADYERFLLLQKQLNLAMGITDVDSRKRLREYRALEDSINIRALDAGYLDMNRSIKTKDVAKALKMNEAAIEFTVDNSNFGALILRKNDNAPQYVRLISFEDLSYCTAPLSQTGGKISRNIQRIYSGTSARGKKLYEEIWKPLIQYLNGVDRIYYSPIGNLLSVALGAIQDTTLTPICQTYDMRLVSSTASIASNNKPQKDNNKLTALAIGDVCYDTDPQFDQRNWVPLDNSIAEIAHFDSICQTKGIKPTIITRNEASEKILRSLSGNSPSLILMSTHGFYFDSERAATENFYINKGLTQINDSVQPNYGIPALKRGGLILANANPAWNNDHPTNKDNDGVITGDEIAELDFSGTKLLVLSACQTGLGESTYTEGINGLQRGFKLAGVKSMILSLWEVDDVAGREFMSEFYENLFSGKERHESFNNAILAMRQKYPRDPFRWAMFVMLD